jgi:peptidoglycan/LPS O-acetylase OafA/YrhL
MGGHRNNNFDALRLVAALAVVVGHAWPLTGRDHPPALGGVPIFTLAVYVFFCLSGYLVATSWNRDPRPRAFLARRAARIFPALIAVVVVTTLVIGPIATSLPLGQYFASGQTWSYLSNVSLVATYDLPGVFADHPRTAVNGVLWSLGPEFLCYLVVLALGVLVGRAVRSVRPAARAAVFAVLALVFAALSLWPDLLSSSARPAVTSMVFFATCAALAQAPDLRLPAWPVLILIPAWFGLVAVLPEAKYVAAWIAIPYLVLALGARSAPVVRRAGRFGDVSYGLYLWGFPLQQLVVQFWPGLPLWLDLLVVVPATLLLAFASWHLLEGRVLEAVRARLALAAREPSERQRSVLIES